MAVINPAAGDAARPATRTIDLVPPAPGRAGVLALAGLLGLIGMGVLVSFATRTPAASAVTSEALPARVWTWDGSALAPVAVGDAGPASDRFDAAYDPARGRIVVWEHGCRVLVLGFTGGCTQAANRTWTLDAAGRWVQVPRGTLGLPPASPDAGGAREEGPRQAVSQLTDSPVGGFAMLYDASRGGMVVIASPIRSR